VCFSSSRIKKQQKRKIQKKKIRGFRYPVYRIGRSFPAGEIVGRGFGCTSRTFVNHTVYLSGNSIKMFISYIVRKLPLECFDFVGPPLNFDSFFCWNIRLLIFSSTIGPFVGPFDFQKVKETREARQFFLQNRCACYSN
jgi:hypothetical protein